MNPGSIFFDKEFAFHDGDIGEKLFVVLGSDSATAVVAKTTSQQHGRGTQYGCQPKDRFHNFFLPDRCCYLKGNSWVCLNEFYELDLRASLKKRLDGKINPICTVPEHLRAIQECALSSLDISSAQAKLVMACLA